MRQISNDCLKEYVTGAVYFKEDDDGLIPYRFSEEKLVDTCILTRWGFCIMLTRLKNG